MAQVTNMPPPGEQDIPPRLDGGMQITIKGTRKGLSVTLGEGDWQELLGELDVRLGQADAFFMGGCVNLHTGQRDITQQELQDLINILQRHDIELASLRTASMVTAEAAQALQVRLALAEVAHVQPERHTSVEQEVSDGVLIRRTLRSGQSLRHPGHVVVIGDVNPGAEVIAGGDVVVWGKLRGMVHAGAIGDNAAIVCALELTPTQLRIGSHIAVSPDEQRDKRPVPGEAQRAQLPARASHRAPAQKAEGSPDSRTAAEVAFVLNGRIVVEPLDLAKDRPWSSR